MKIVMQNRTYLMEDDRWKVDEAKRPIQNKNGKQHFGSIQGSFRSLNID